MKNIISLTAVFLLLISVACKKNELGGKATIKGSIKHHAKAIANATVFIKFKAKEFPGADTTLYDDKVKADAEGNYTIKCYKGDYYLFAYGHDPAIAAPYTVVGGSPVHIRNKESLVIDLAVTEGD